MYFEMYRDARGVWRWRLKASNHEVIAVSSEGYASKQSCSHSIDLVKSTTAGTPVKEV